MFDSVRIRLTFWYVGVLALVIIAFVVLTYFFTLRILNQDTNTRLEEMSRNFAIALKAEESDEEESRNTEQIIVETVNEFRFRDYQFVVFAGDGRLIASTADFKIQENNQNRTSNFRDFANEREKFRLYDSPLEIKQNQYRLVVLHSLREQITFENRLLNIFLVAVPLVILLAGFGGYFLARKALAPVIKMTEQARQIGAKNLNERLWVRNERDELGKLSGVFNDLLARLESAFEQQRRFMADASHELRTPLAIVRGESEVALAKEDRPNADYRTSLAVVHDESERLTKIVEDLFTLARADAGQFRASFAPVYLDEIVSECVRAISVLAQKRQIDLKFSSEAEMPFSGDESLLRRLFLNLLDNAIKYNRSGGKISIVCEMTRENFSVKITDSGRGIPQDEQTHIFDRFYRVDKARSRQAETETSGAGLGLSIARWITEIHRGEIKLISSNETGSTFQITFPR